MKIKLKQNKDTFSSTGMIMSIHSDINARLKQHTVWNNEPLIAEYHLNKGTKHITTLRIFVIKTQEYKLA